LGVGYGALMNAFENKGMDYIGEANETASEVIKVIKWWVK